MFQNRLFFALASRSGFGPAISAPVARSSIVFCNSVFADRIVMAASRLLRALAAFVILLSFAAGLRKSYWSGCMKAATVICQQISSILAVVIFLLKILLKSASKSSFFSLWRRDPVLQPAQLLLCRTCKTYQLTVSAYCRSTSLRTACAFAMALAAYDWRVWKDRAASFLRAHPGEVALQLTWGQRLVVPGAREAYAVATYEREAMGRSLGAAPCNLCGCWTHSWCEACKTRPPTAICSTCDAAKLLCQSCTSCHQLVYSEASQKPN